MLALLFAVLVQNDPKTEERLKRLEKEVEELKKSPAPQRHDPAIHLSGYGDAHLNSPELDTFNHTADARADLHHLVIGAGVDFNDWISAEFEVDFEHAGNEVEAEFAWIDLHVVRALSFRAGLLLIPVGSLNENHEPPHYFSVERPYFDRYFIHTTFTELGAGIFGELPFECVSVRYRLYAVAGLDPTRLAALDILDEAEGHAKESIATGIAFTGRVEVQPAPWITLGVSGYAGRAQRSNLHTPVNIGTADLTLQYAGAVLHVEGGMIWIDNAEQVSAFTPDGPVAEVAKAWYVEGGYDLLYLLSPGSDFRLVIFARYEWIDTQAEMPDTLVQTPGGRRSAVIAGVAFYLTADVVIKADYEFWENDADQDIGRFNIGIGYQFHIK